MYLQLLHVTAHTPACLPTALPSDAPEAECGYTRDARTPFPLSGPGTNILKFNGCVCACERERQRENCVSLFPAFLFLIK